MKMSYAIAIIGTIVYTIIIMMGGCYGITKLIVHCKSCERFNIDNTELRTNTNIKNAKDFWCRYDERSGIKTTVFYMDIKGKELRNYIGAGGFAKIPTEIPLFENMKVWDDSLKNIPRSNLYYKRGSYKNDRWLLVLDSATATLWAELIETKPE